MYFTVQLFCAEIIFRARREFNFLFSSMRRFAFNKTKYQNLMHYIICVHAQDGYSYQKDESIAAVSRLALYSECGRTLAESAPHKLAYTGSSCKNTNPYPDRARVMQRDFWLAATCKRSYTPHTSVARFADRKQRYIH